MADSKISDLAAVTDVLGTDEYELARSGASKKIAASELLGVGADLTLVVDQDGSSLASWNQDAGSWSTAGGIISVDSTGGEARLEYNADVLDQALRFIVQTDIRISSTGLSAANDLAGFVWNWDGSTTTGTPACRLIFTSGGAKQINLEHKGTSALSSATFAWAADTWYTMRVAVMGPTVSAYVDGTWLTATQGATTIQGLRVGLYASGVNVDYDNIKVWSESFTV